MSDSSSCVVLTGRSWIGREDRDVVFVQVKVLNSSCVSSVKVEALLLHSRTAIPDLAHLLIAHDGIGTSLSVR